MGAPGAVSASRPSTPRTRKRAIAPAYRKALAVEPASTMPLLASLGSTPASTDAEEETLSWLAKARASGKLDMTEEQAAPEFGYFSLRSSASPP